MKLQDHILKYSGHRAFIWIVFTLTVFESIFLFIPPEIFMTPPIIANKKRAPAVVIAAALGSLIGGAIAYAIGLWLFDSLGMWLINNVSNMEQFEYAQSLFAKHGVFIIFLTAVTPVPYKLMSICAGFLGFSPAVYLGLSAIFRTARFAIVGTLLWKFQERANAITKKYFWWLMIIAILAAVFGIGLMMII